MSNDNSSPGLDGSKLLSIFAATHPEMLEGEPNLQSIAQRVRAELEAKGIDAATLVSGDVEGYILDCGNCTACTACVACTGAVAS